MEQARLATAKVDHVCLFGRSLAVEWRYGSWSVGGVVLRICQTVADGDGAGDGRLGSGWSCLGYGVLTTALLTVSSNHRSPSPNPPLMPPPLEPSGRMVGGSFFFDIGWRREQLQLASIQPPYSWMRGDHTVNSVGYIDYCTVAPSTPCSLTARLRRRASGRKLISIRAKAEGSQVQGAR